MNESAVYEWLAIYLYRADGTYTRPDWIKSPQELVARLPEIHAHVQNGLEVRITNGDDELLFHAENNRIEWDGLGLTETLR